MTAVPLILFDSDLHFPRSYRSWSTVNLRVRWRWIMVPQILHKHTSRHTERKTFDNMLRSAGTVKKVLGIAGSAMQCVNANKRLSYLYMHAYLRRGGNSYLSLITSKVPSRLEYSTSYKEGHLCRIHTFTGFSH